VNWPTIIVASIIALIFIAIVAGEIRKRRNGKGGCSCGCGGCAMRDACHQNNSDK